MLIKILGTNVCLIRKSLVVDRLQVGIKSIRTVGALHLQEQLAFSDGVAEASLDINYAAAGKRDDGDLASDIRIHRAGDLQLRSSFDPLCGNQRKLIRLINGNQTHIAGSRILGWRRSPVSRVEFFFTCGQREAYGEATDTFQKGLVHHWITSRPTARFNWLAAVR